LAHEWNPSAPPVRGRIIVIGGQCSKVGKTALIVDLLSALCDAAGDGWTAVKITPHIESSCPVNGSNCGCGPAEHPFSVREEKSVSSQTDTSRFLAAGAKRAFWLQTRPSHLLDALPALADLLVSTNHAIIESNALLEFWRPAAVFMVLDPSNPDFKPSALEAMSLADGFVLRSPFQPSRSSERVAALSAKPTFLQLLGQPLPAGVHDLARQLLCLPSHPSTVTNPGRA
jgi:hypothetical protein